MSHSTCSTAAHRGGGLRHHRLKLRDGTCGQEPGRVTQGPAHLAAPGQSKQECQRFHQETGRFHQVSGRKKHKEQENTSEEFVTFGFQF